ncbi:MAG: TlpA family protein disulfide reductase [Candidatus Eisenbacteria bacterium]|uniref:TlpA family protein disulfide reductase n=1 Tax=Eiseniibacteriota bacterium TaxID=2212470 RepID=A0A538U2R2_UNCEI|nr:MAG: TlpA family protein disulfide reductase [Candidatus Eisenbacteria bacterium]
MHDMRPWRIARARDLLLLLTLAGGRFALASEPPSARAWSFRRSVVNLESYSGSLQPEAPPAVHRGLPKDSTIWYGEIFRQLPSDVPTSREHAVPFAVRMQAGVAQRAWVDANLNGDLTDDEPPPLSRYPGDPGARSFLTALRWAASVDGGTLPIEREVRVVIDPAASPDIASDYRIQDVFGMLGTVEIEGATHRALLFDANHDGIYTRGHGDGVFFDLDDDHHFEIDPMAVDFGPFAMPFSILHRSMVVDSVSSDGSRVVVRDVGPAPSSRAPARGRMAPDFTFVDLDGKLQRLSAHRGRPTVVYFWASWCANCRGQALELRAMYERSGPRGWDLLGIDCDTDRAEALRFRDQFGETWPTSVTGLYMTENPVTRLYHEDLVGIFYVVGSDGILADKVSDVDALKAALDKLLEAGKAPTQADTR